MLSRPFHPLAAVTISLALQACSGGGERSSHAPQPLAEGEKPLIYVSVPPQVTIVTKITGDLADVRSLIPEGQDPHLYAGTPQQVVKLSRAHLYCTVGMPFEKTLADKLKDSARVHLVNTAQGLIEEPAGHAHGHEHDHGHGEHGDEGSDPHIWLSPPLIKKQARTIFEALIQLDPSNKPTYEANLAAFEFELDALHQELSDQLAPFKGKPFFVYHGAFDQFAKTYGLRQVSIQVGGQSPDPKHLYALIEEAKEENVKIIFVQPQFDESSAAIVAKSIGGTVEIINPLAQDPLANMKLIARAIASALGKSDPP